MEWEARDRFHRGESVGGPWACLPWGLVESCGWDRMAGLCSSFLSIAEQPVGKEKGRGGERGKGVKSV